jgi:CheY-like chemotaxis protein
MTRTLFQQAPTKDIDTYVAQGVARALYVHAFQMWSIDVEPPPDVSEGRDWEEVAPDTVMNRAAGIQAARELEDGIAQKNPGLGRFPYAAMFKNVTSASDADFDTRIRGVHPDAAGRSFGALLASVCLGTDEPGPLAQFALPTVHVELDDDGREMSWDMSWEDIPESMVNPSTNPGERWPNSSVQSLLFSGDRYTVRQAQRWAQDHGYKYGSVDTTENYHRLRQFQPAHDQPCRTIEFGHGIQAIVCATRNPSGKQLGIEILVMEDDPKIQARLARMLKQIVTNPHVIFADNVGAAIADLEVHEFGLVISDVNVLGPRTGLDLFRHIQDRYPQLVDRFVFFTENEHQLRSHHHRVLVKSAATADDLKRVLRAPGQGARPGQADAAPPPQPMTLAEFASAVKAALPAIPESPGPSGMPMGRFGDKVFIAAAWRALERAPGFRAFMPSLFKRRLVEANQQGLVDLARMDARGDADPEEVEESEIVDRGATFHMIRDRSARQRQSVASMDLPEFAKIVREMLPQVKGSRGPNGRTQGRSGHKVFISAAYRLATRDPRFTGMTLAEFKKQLARAHKESLLDLSRADLVGAFEPAEVAESEYAPERYPDGRPVWEAHFIRDDVGEPYYG